MFEVRYTVRGLVPITQLVHLMILREIDSGASSLADIKRRLPTYPQSTLIYHLEALVREGVLTKRTREDGFFMLSDIYRTRKRDIL